MSAKTKKAKSQISPTGKQIIDFLKSVGGAGSVGIIAANRSLTIRHLRRLETQNLIECLDPPETFKSIADKVGIEGKALTCGIWRIRNNAPAFEKTRSCSFCGFKASYDEHSDGAICFEGICACADCLKTDETKTFRLLLDEENIAYQSRFEEKNHG